MNPQLPPLTGAEVPCTRMDALMSANWASLMLRGGGDSGTAGKAPTLTPNEIVLVSPFSSSGGGLYSATGRLAL